MATHKANLFKWSFPPVPPERKRKEFKDGDDVCRYIKEWSDPKEKTRIGFSMGKDSLGTLIQVRRHFKEYIPVFLEDLPLGLGFVEEQVAYYEKALGTKIVRVAHPGSFRMLNECLLRAPSSAALIVDGLRVPEPSFEDFYHSICVQHGMKRPWGAIGVRAADSITRRTTISKHGPVNYSLWSYCPIFDWDVARLSDEIKKSGLKLPAMYRAAGRSFDAYVYSRLLPIKRYWPQDYEKIVEEFPMVECEMLRYKKMGLPVE